MSGHRDVPLDSNISHHLILLTIVILLSVVTAIIFYDGPFLFWQFALSDLGAVGTKYGTDNILSRYIFNLGFLIAAYILGRISTLYANGRHLTYPKIKSKLALLACVGFLVFVYPHDLNKKIHSLGAGLMVGSLYLMANLFMVELKDEFPLRLFILYQILLHGSVLSYAVTYFAHLPVRQITQKFCFGSLVYIIDQIALRNVKEVSVQHLLRIRRAHE